MKKIFYAIALASLTAVSATALDLGASLSVSPGLIYNGNWDPAISGGSLSINVRAGSPALAFRGGLECGIEGLGTQVLFPLGIERTITGNETMTFGVRAAVIPGLALFRPYPLFMMGGEAGAYIDWFWNEQWGVEFDLAARYLACPEYSARVAPYKVFNLPTSISIRYRLN
jgi:hypothetical protein